MTAEPDLLPLPEPTILGVSAAHSGRAAYIMGHNNKAMMDYARANVAHAIAPLQAEIEALRADLESTMDGRNGEMRARLQAEARAERLAEALQRQRGWWSSSKKEAVSNAPGGMTRIDPGFIALCDAHIQKIDAALEQEAGR